MPSRLCRTTPTIMLVLAALASAAACPTVTTLGHLNLTGFTEHTWYIQQQQITGYQSLDTLFCVTATYELDEGKTVPFFSGKVVAVHNYANKGKVNGPLENTSNMTLCARANNATDSSRLLVAPCFLPNLLAGPYWVLGIGDDYEWAVIIGGQPTEEYADGCTTSEKGVNHSGLWLFTRAPVASKASLDAMHALLKAQGVAASRLHTVEQEGCLYKGDPIK